MSTNLTLKQGEKAPESGIYESRRSNQRITLRKGQCAPLTPKLGEEWERVVDASKLRKLSAPPIARIARPDVAAVRSS
jgi:hypothetical protein